MDGAETRKVGRGQQIQNGSCSTSECIGMGREHVEPEGTNCVCSVIEIWSHPAECHTVNTVGNSSQLSSVAWCTVSNAADRSNMTKATNSLWSRQSSIGIMWRTVWLLSILCLTANKWTLVKNINTGKYFMREIKFAASKCHKINTEDARCMHPERKRPITVN